jgi:hypothetical protein
MRKRSQFSVEQYNGVAPTAAAMGAATTTVTEAIVGTYGKTGKLVRAANKAQKVVRELQTLLAQESGLVGASGGDTAGVDSAAV